MSTLAIDVAARTDIGLVRRRNEDACYAGRHLFAVADGLGGHVAGDIASATVIEVLRSFDRPTASTDITSVLGQAVYAANEALRRRIETEPKLAGMGTTLVAMLWSGSAVGLANVGDCRAYLVRGKTSPMIQITEDHTYGNLVADAADVPNLPGRISRFLDGRADGRSPDLTIRSIQAGDRFLLCSDGLSGVVPHEAIQNALIQIEAPEEACKSIVDMAVGHGGPDNITVVIVDVREHQPN
ncbi:protein phosphatase 2C domain-containing protein [Thermopolyspora sp. NPDC052614]|uniref:PP2C family protein-serine/threonine phosphatase n=1 Tax=Thermopolyspora sp. NPDC052614 TaxID=3155682 RepID=UPI00341CC874